MIEQLFGSKTRVKLLKLFYGNPNRSFYVREITRKIGEQINSVRRELSNLLNIGIITSDTTNNKLYYEVNQNYEFYGPLLDIFGSGSKTKAKSQEYDQDDNSAMKALGHVELILFSGQLTRDSRANVDVLIVGSVNKNAVTKYISTLEAEEDKDLRYAVMKLDDFQYRQQIKDRFITQILNSKYQVILDRQHLLE